MDSSNQKLFHKNINEATDILTQYIQLELLQIHAPLSEMPKYYRVSDIVSLIEKLDIYKSIPDNFLTELSKKYKTTNPGLISKRLLESYENLAKANQPAQRGE